jgi:hypothetical protein
LSLFFSQNQIGCNWKQQEAKICYRIDVSCYSIIVWCGGLFIERGIRLHGSTANFNSTLFYASHTLFSGGHEFRFSGPGVKCKQTDVIRTGWHKKKFFTRLPTRPLTLTHAAAGPGWLAVILVEIGDGAETLKADPWQGLTVARIDCSAAGAGPGGQT